MSLKYDYIAKIDAVLDDYDEQAADDLVGEIISVFAGEDEHIKSGLYRYKAWAIAPGSKPPRDNRGDLLKLRGKLSVLCEAESRKHEADYVCDPTKCLPGTFNFNVNASAVNQNTVETTVTVSQVAEQVQSFPQYVLNDDQKKEIKALLLDLDTVKGKPKEDAEKPVKKILSWLADKGVDVAVAVLPYVVQTITSI